MLRLQMSDVENYVNQKLASKNESSGLIEFVCTPHSGRWAVVLNDNLSEVSIIIRSAREDVRLFASIDSAFKAVNHLTTSMTIIGK